MFNLTESLAADKYQIYCRSLYRLQCLNCHMKTPSYRFRIVNTRQDSPLRDENRIVRLYTQPLDASG